MKNILKISSFIISSLMIFMSVAGCSNDISYEPREVNPEIDACEICNMSIVHTDFATQLIEKDGTVHMYDDIGCMIEFIEGGGKDKEIAATFVRDYDTLEWVPFEQAYHAYHPAFWTPMAYGVVSFATKEQAEAFVEKEGKGEVLDYEGLQKIDWVMHNHES